MDQVNAKLNEYMAKDQFHAVIVHVGTNDLVHECPEAVAMKMDDLIANMKGNVKRIAVSSVIKRYDGRVAASSITHFNNLVKSLCAQHNITFINNDHIDKSFLNRSNLHLNKIGDTALGRAFCTYLRSIRNESVSPQNSFFLRCLPSSQEGVDKTLREREADDESLDNCNISNNASSDFLTSLNSVPSKKGFKMAFLNIVSLPENIDEKR